MRTRNFRRGAGSLLALLAVGTATAVSGCSILTPTASNSGEAAPVSTVVPDEEVTITISDWDNSESMKTIIAEFEKKYPQVTVKHEYTEASNYQKTLKLVMQSENPPDIVQYNTPIRELGAAGLVLDLTPYEDAYGWDDIIPTSLLDQTRFSEDGKTMGTGALLAAPNTVPIVGVFYNKSLTEKAAVDGVPADLGEFEADLQKVKESAALPLEMGALDFGGIHNLSAILNSQSKADAVRSWLFGESGSDLTPSLTDSAETMRAWSENGYYASSANGTGDSDAAAKFADGGAAYMITGSWNATAFQDGLGDDVGFFLLPMTSADDPVVATASVSAYSVSAKSKHQAAAVAFLDFMYSKEAAPGVTLTGNLSLNPEANAGLEGVHGEIADAYAMIAESDGAVIFPDQSAPALLDVLTSDIQLVLAGRKDPGSFADDVQATWADYHE